jgi:cellulose 1,4-beta-cellobiosidase
VNVVSLFSRSPRRLLHGSGIAGALVASFLSFSTSIQAQNACAVSTGGANPTAADVTAATNMALGTQTCSAQVEGNNVCTVITVQRVIEAVPNAYTGQRTYNGQPLCVTYKTHAAHLNWTASTTGTVTSYNVYRATALAGPYTQIATLVLAATACNGTNCTWTDTSVTAGTTYYYEVTAVAALVESAATSAILATIPSP